MTKESAKSNVKAWPIQYKEAVRRDVKLLTENPQRTKICAHTAFIIEKCCKRGIEIDPIELLSFL